MLKMCSYSTVRGYFDLFWRIYSKRVAFYYGFCDNTHMEITVQQPDSAPTRGNTAVAYLRVSTSEQADSKLGLKAQKESIRKYAKSQGLTIRKYYTDAGISGAKGVSHRPALSEMLTELQPGQTVLVHRMDRLSRDLYLNLWIEKECKKVSCFIDSASNEGNGDSPTDKLLRNIIGSFAEFERELISQRTKAAMAKLNRKVGRPPYGFKYDSVGRLVKNNGEHQNLMRLMELRQELGNKWTQISKMMNAENRPTQKGKDWYPGTAMKCVLRFEKDKKYPEGEAA